MAAGNLLVGLYTDDKELSVKHDSPLSVEDICRECLSHLQIDFTYIHLFGLYDIDEKLWLCPNHMLAPSPDLEKYARYMFRIRYPRNSIKEEKFLFYLHLHYRYCFTKEFPVDNIQISLLFGFGVLDLLISAYENKEHISSMFQGNRYMKFFSENLLKKYNYMEKLLMKWNLRKRSRRKHKEYRNNQINRLKTSYIDGLEKLFYAHINKESYEYTNKEGKEMVVSVKEKDSEFRICFEDESYSLASVRSVKIQNGFVEIYFKGSSLKMLKMRPEIAKSFVSTIDALYRLAYNYHYGICEEVFSPRIKELQTLGCFDYIDKTVVAEILKNHEQKSSYLMRMRPDAMDVFDVFTLNSENTNLEEFVVGPNPDCQYESIESLLKAQESLQYKIKPSHFEWCDLLFCHMPVKPGYMPLINPQLDKENQVFQSSEISLSEKTPFHKGIFTEMYKAKLQDCKMLVSITTLRAFPNSSYYAQVFMKEIDSMLQMGKCPQFLQMKGVTLQPNFGVISELPLRSAANYLADKELSLTCILKMALTVAEGLEFLRKKGIVHGDINCENLQMIDTEIVRITDPSIVNKVYLLPEDNAIYKSRLPWLDPWLQKNPSQPTFESDIYSYGAMLCEMLCFDQKPPKLNPINKKATFLPPCRLLFDVSQNPDKAEMASHIQKQLYTLIIKCKQLKKEDRPQPQDISATLEELVHEEIILPTTDHPNSLCDHNWKRPYIELSKISEAIEIIQKKSQEFKAPKSVPDYIIDPKFIRKESEIGKGAFGIVYQGRYFQRLVAIKTLQKLENSRSEVKILQQLKHIRIVDFIGFCNEKEIVMEYVSGGDLHTRLLKNKRALIKHLTQVLYEIVEGMEYLQQNVIIHRDLAARNILLTEDDHVKITDFGLSKKIDHGDDYKIHSHRMMPLLWSAPEREVISCKSDVWSFGVVMWECYSCGDKPVLNPNFTPVQHLAELKNGKRLPRPSQCPQGKYKIMEDCWRYEQIKRPDFTELKEKFL